MNLNLYGWELYNPVYHSTTSPHLEVDTSLVKRESVKVADDVDKPHVEHVLAGKME